MDWGRCILCQKHSTAPLLDPSCNSNNTVFVYVNLKSNIEEFKRSEVPCVGILVHFNELHVGDGLIQNLKKGKAKWHKNYVLELSVSKSVK